MPSYLYYKRANEWVRVQADAYTRENRPPLFQGGQCECVAYNVYLAATTKAGAFFDIGLIRVRGKIGNVVVSPNGATGERFSLECRGEFRLNCQTFPYLETVLTASKGNFTNCRITSLSRMDGNPDNCGDPPGGGCFTKFTLNGSTVLILDSCPEVSNGLGCSDCCGELVAIAKKIQV